VFGQIVVLNMENGMDHFNDSTFHGRGEDHIGSFMLSGSFSKETQQMTLAIIYKVCRPMYAIYNDIGLFLVKF
jgi:hypothetical protein